MLTNNANSDHTNPDHTNPDQESVDKITLSPIQDSEDLYEEPYKVLSIEIDDWNTAVIHETMQPISVLYHPITGRLNVLVLQDYVSWAHMNKEQFEKEHTERKRRGQELNLAVASEHDQEIEESKTEKSKTEEQESISDSSVSNPSISTPHKAPQSKYNSPKSSTHPEDV